MSFVNNGKNSKNSKKKNQMNKSNLMPYQITKINYKNRIK